MRKGRRTRHFPFEAAASHWMMERMELEQTIAEIERLKRIFALPDTRPPNASDLAAASQRHDLRLANSPQFRIWQRYGVCCRTESPINRLGEIET